MNIRAFCVAAFAVASAASAFPIAINPGTYTGRYYVDGAGPNHGALSFALAQGAHSVDDGTMIGGSAFAFSVDAAGQVTLTGSSAVSTGAGLRFNNATITIDPAGYAGAWGFSAYAPDLYAASAARDFVVIPDLLYTLDAGSFIGSSAFIFKVTATGQIASISSASATASGNRLTFRTASVAVDVGGFVGRYIVGPLHALTSGSQSFTLVPDLAYSLDDGSAIGGSSLVFQLDPAGQVSGAVTPTGAGSAVGGKLVFGNIHVGVDPGGYAGTYQIGSGVPLSGSSDVVLIPGLATVLSALGTAATFTPSPAGVTPPSLTLAGATFGLTILRPTVTAISPPALAQGANAAPVTITGTRFASGAKLTFSAAGVTAANVIVVSATQLTAAVTVASNAAPGAVDVTVSSGGLAGTGAALLTITTLQALPASFSAQATALAPTVAAPLTAGVTAAVALAPTNPVAARAILAIELQAVLAAPALGLMTQAAADALAASLRGLIAAI
jgi:hypothetical protein